MAIGQLFLWSVKRGEWTNCPHEEITWLDRALLSGNEDLTLHRAPRCAGLRYVHHVWELFNRDTSHRVYLAPDTAGQIPGPDAVRRAACHVLPVAPARYESLPVTLDDGVWLVSVGSWVVRLRHEAQERPDVEPARGGDSEAITRESELMRRGGAPGADAVARVRSYFQRNARAQLAMAYYYQEFILARPAPQPVPMINVVIALDLSGEGAVSDYKKMLQGFIWQERGHARDLAGFLLGNGLLTPADLDEARRVAKGNERAGICEQARLRLKYRPKET
ncbi:MAG TPA: hypothetical protein VHZ03_58080 [Trebonia sp.]|nr:hypothetical protein [Trebonia sp.]